MVKRTITKTLLLAVVIVVLLALGVLLIILGIAAITRKHTRIMLWLGRLVRLSLVLVTLLVGMAAAMVGVLCALNMLFLIGLGFFLFGQVTVSKGGYLLGVPPLLTTLFALALVSALLTVGSVVGTILAWWGRFWCVGRRVHYTQVALAALAFTWELLYWNLLGFRA